jgi:hypothetical protein
VPKGKGRIEIERVSKSDVGMVTIWQHVCQKLHLEVKLDDFICVGNDATVAEEVREGNNAFEVLTERNGKSGSDVSLQ